MSALGGAVEADGEDEEAIAVVVAGLEEGGAGGGADFHGAAGLELHVEEDEGGVFRRDPAAVGDVEGVGDAGEGGGVGLVEGEGEVELVEEGEGLVVGEGELEVRGQGGEFGGDILGGLSRINHANIHLNIICLFILGERRRWGEQAEE